MFNRNSVVVAVAAMSLGIGSTCTFVHADDTPTPQDKQVQDKNPAAAGDKSKTDDMTSDADMQSKMATQEKMKSDLLTTFNDADFVKVASMANADEIAAAKMALVKTHSDDVKMFAQHMIDDHTKAGDELKSLAEAKGWQFSDVPDAKHMMMAKDMNMMEPADFDKAYATGAVKDHEDAVALFKLASDKASDDQLKTWVGKMLPNFQDHLKMAQDLESKLSAMPMTK